MTQRHDSDNEGEKANVEISHVGADDVEHYEVKVGDKTYQFGVNHDTGTVQQDRGRYLKDHGISIEKAPKKVSIAVEEWVKEQ